MRSTCLLAAAMLTSPLISGCASTSVVEIAERDIHWYSSGVVGGDWHGTVPLGLGMAVPASIEITSKGNGMLSILNLHVAVYDSHDDTQVFEPPLASIRFVDLDGDGYRDLVIMATEVKTDEKSGEALSKRLVGQVFRFEPSHHVFVPCEPEQFKTSPSMLGRALRSPSRPEAGSQSSADRE